MAKTPVRRFMRVVVVALLFVVGVAMSISTATADTGSASGSGGPGASGSASGSAGSSTGPAPSGSSSGSAAPVLPIPSLAGLTALSWATTQMGKPYRWGGTGPNSWDCSGLVQWSFHQAGVRLPRTTWQQAKAGYAVPLGSLAPGDIVVVNRDGSHVGIYLGFGQLFNAYGDGVPVGVAALSRFHIYAIRRL